VEPTTLLRMPWDMTLRVKSWLCVRAIGPPNWPELNKNEQTNPDDRGEAEGASVAIR
jgi:hypothetical protein